MLGRVCYRPPMRKPRSGPFSVVLAASVALVLGVAPAQAHRSAHARHPQRHAARPAKRFDRHPVTSAQAHAASEQLAVFSGEGSEYHIERCWAQGRRTAAGCAAWVTFNTSLGPGRLTVRAEAWREGNEVCAMWTESLIESNESFCVDAG